MTSAQVILQGSVFLAVIDGLWHLGGDDVSIGDDDMPLGDLLVSFEV